jgi:hypothetical protein
MKQQMPATCFATASFVFAESMLHPVAQAPDTVRLKADTTAKGQNLTPAPNLIWCDCICWPAPMNVLSALFAMMRL